MQSAVAETDVPGQVEESASQTGEVLAHRVAEVGEVSIARRLSSHTPDSLAYIKRLVRNATETPLAEGLALERNLFLKLCISEPALARIRSYVEANITSPSRSIVVEGD